MSPTDDRRFAKDVARELHRRQTRRRVLLWTTLLGLLAAAAMYMRCGGSWGFGGDGKGEGEGGGKSSTVEHSDAGPKRCVIRVAAAGITVDGATATRQQAVKTCKATAGADVTVTGGARQGDFDELRAALEAAGIPFKVIDASSGSGTPNWAPKL